MDDVIESIEVQFEKIGKQTRVRIDSPSHGQRHVAFKMPLTSVQAASRLELNASRENQAAIGQALFKALKQDLQNILLDALNQARTQRRRFVLQLRFDEHLAALAALPWELLHDGRRHLLAAGLVDLSRYISYPEGVTPLRAELPMHILQVTALPKGKAPLALETSRRALKTAAKANRLLVVEQLKKPTYQELMRRLEMSPAIQALHFDGHGGFEQGKAVLYFEDENGDAEAITTEDLHIALANRVSLAVLNACHSAAIPDQASTIFESLAPALIEAGIPAVMGMQFPVFDEAANNFIGAFYGALARGEPLVQAMTIARRWLYRENSWYIPALYLRSTDPLGQLFSTSQQMAVQVLPQSKSPSKKKGAHPQPPLPATFPESSPETAKDNQLAQAKPPLPNILLITATKTEAEAVSQACRELTGHDPRPHLVENRVYHDLGEIYGAQIYLGMLTEMGTAGPGASLQTTAKGIAAFRPTAVIMVGIAFGAKPGSQTMGDVLVSQQLMHYEPQRVGATGTLPRGDRVHPSPTLLNWFKGMDLYWRGANVHFGLILTGEKLVDNLEFRRELCKIEPEAIGGEMEGAGLYVACQDQKVDWLLVKGICDWADGHKNENKKLNQQVAALNAARFVLHTLQLVQLNQALFAFGEQIKQLEDELRLAKPPRDKEVRQSLLTLEQQQQLHQAKFAQLTTPVGTELVLPEKDSFARSASAAFEASSGTVPSPVANVVTSLVPFPETWLARLPYPVAIKCQLANQMPGVSSRFAALDGLLLATVKYLATIALAQFRKDLPHAPQLRPWLARLSRRYLGELLQLLADIDRYYRQDMANRPAVAARFDDVLNRTVLNDSALWRAHQEILDRLPGRTQQQPSNVLAFLRDLVAYRENTWGTGFFHIPPEFAETLLPILWPAWHELLLSLDFLSDYPLRYAVSAKLNGELREYELLEWRGPADAPVACREQLPITKNYKERRLYLCLPNGEPLLNLHPLLIHFRPKCRLHFMEFFEEDETLVFRDCQSAEILEIPDDLRASLLTIYEPLAGEEKETGVTINEVEAQVDKLNEDEPPPPTPTPMPAPELSLPELLERLSGRAHRAFAIGLGESLRIGQFWLGVEFLLMGLSRLDDGPLAEILGRLRVVPGEFRGFMRGLIQVKAINWRAQRDVEALGSKALPDLQEANPASLAQVYTDKKLPNAVITPRLLFILRQAAKYAGGRAIEPEHLLFTSLQHHQCLAVNLFLGLMVQGGLDPHAELKHLQEKLAVDQLPVEPAPEAFIQPPDPPGAPPTTPLRPEAKGVLARLGRDLTALATDNQLQPAIGASARKAMTQIGLILQQTQSNNPILLGDPGVGKTAIVEGFVYRLVKENLANWRVIDLSPGELLAGTKYRGDLEERLKQLLDEVRRANRQVIIFIDEIHSLLGGKGEGGLGSLADMLKPALARGEFPCIGATTVGEYRRHIEADPALARRFSPIWIDEPSPDEAVEIAKRVARERLGPHHRVLYPDEAIEEAVRLAVRYLHEEFLPGKALKLLDQSGPRVTMGGSLSGLKQKPPALLPDPGTATVSIEILRAIVSERTGIPLTQLEQDERTRLLNLENKLRERVKGQEEALAEVSKVVKRARAGLADPNRPPGVFLFAGPTGVGKTELALALAEALFDQQDAIFRLDMSEFLEKHQVSRLIGSPPGYIGHEEEGRLTGRLRRRPYSIILLDEMEKAHPEVQHLFLQLFDAGRLTDSRGNLADGRNAIFIMTTNKGAKEALGFINQRIPYREKLQAAIAEHFSPEFLNRIDRVVYFSPLTQELLIQIFDKLFARAAARFKAQHIEVTVMPEFKEKFCKMHITSFENGARPLERAIDDHIIAPLTDKLLAGEIRPHMKVTLGEGEPMLGDVLPPLAARSPVNMPPSSEQKIAPRGLKGSERDRVTEQNQQRFDNVWAATLIRLQEVGLEVEITSEARDYLCDPFWNENRPLQQALTDLVETPLRGQLTDQRLAPGDRVRVTKYAADLQFEKVIGVE